MNAPTLNDLRNALPVRDLSGRDLAARDLEARDLADEKMTQVRDLLVGDFIKESQARMMALETRIRDLENGLGQRLSVLTQQIETLGQHIGTMGQHIGSMDQRIETVSVDHTVDRQAAFDELSKCILDLGDKIRAISR